MTILLLCLFALLCLSVECTSRLLPGDMSVTWEQLIELRFELNAENRQLRKYERLLEDLKRQGISHLSRETVRLSKLKRDALDNVTELKEAHAILLQSLTSK
jgi:hypothetical protein